MNIELILMADDDIVDFKKNIQYAFQKGFEDVFGMRLKSYIRIQRYGKPVLHILKKETFTFM